MAGPVRKKFVIWRRLSFFLVKTTYFSLQKVSGQKSPDPEFLEPSTALRPYVLYYFNQVFINFGFSDVREDRKFPFEL
jgi:hypothetical protein